MFSGNKKIIMSELEGRYEITEEQAKKKPKWGSGNIAVNEDGSWKWMACDHDTSG
mgnify:CR=1 FL=1